MQPFKKNYESGKSKLIIWNVEIKDIIKIVRYNEESGLLIKGVSETIENEIKELNNGFFGKLLGTSGASLLENILAGKWVIQAGKWKIITSQEF